MKPLADQLACVRRELALRRNVYPKWVRDGRMAQAEANEEIATMEAVLANIEKLKLLEEVSEEMKQNLPFD